MHREYSSNHGRKYAIFKHHAWAGTALLSVLLALRILFTRVEEINIPDGLAVVIGLILVVYILVSLFFTYRYRDELIAKDESIGVSTVGKKVCPEIKSEKEQLKIEKKKAKTEIKKAKKLQKTLRKKEKVE